MVAKIGTSFYHIRDFMVPWPTIGVRELSTAEINETVQRLQVLIPINSLLEKYKPNIPEDFFAFADNMKADLEKMLRAFI